MNSIESFEAKTYRPLDSSPGTVISVSLGLLVLMYLLYDHFEKQIQALQKNTNETTKRFHITEDKLATLEELEEEVRKLKDVAAEDKSSWEDDITEPEKYQAIVGKGIVEGIEYEFRFIREKLNTFKSNRYWLLSEVPFPFIHEILRRHFQNIHMADVSTKPIYSCWEPNDIDYFIRIDCKILKNETTKKEVNFRTVCDEARTVYSKVFKWRRTLIDTTQSI